MYAAIVQASTMEHTLASLNGTGIKVIDFEQFFELCLTTAKHIDKHIQTASKKKREFNQAKQKDKSTPASSTPAGNQPKKSTYFDPEIWAKMTPEAQKLHLEKNAAARKTRQATAKAARVSKAAATASGNPT